MDRATLLAVAGEAEADPRTVQRIVQGERVRGMVDARVRRALAARGIHPATSPEAEARATQRSKLEHAMGLTRPAAGARLVGNRQVLGAHELDEDTARKLNELDDEANR